jgi:ATP/ADP translocase
MNPWLRRTLIVLLIVSVSYAIVFAAATWTQPTEEKLQGPFGLAWLVLTPLCGLLAFALTRPRE